MMQMSKKTKLASARLEARMAEFFGPRFQLVGV
jgi:hypothetical protein